jgi:hypothetical protein
VIPRHPMHHSRGAFKQQVGKLTIDSFNSNSATEEETFSVTLKPSTFALLGTGITGVAGLVWRRFSWYSLMHATSHTITGEVPSLALAQIEVAYNLVLRELVACTGAVTFCANVLGL